MSNYTFESEYLQRHEQRFQKTLQFLDGLVSKEDRILDIGPPNPFSQIMTEQGYQVTNTPEKLDLDLKYHTLFEENYDVITAFEIFEHLLSPFPLLHGLKAEKLFASVPLRLWFSRAYWNEADPYDRHYHEFEPRQFDMLLDKAGWEIRKSEQWVSKSNKIGIRPLLRMFTPRHYIVYCERK